MKDFFNYLNSGSEDKEWGLYLTVAGRYTSPPQANYPKKSHPSGYYFDWEIGRVLNEYQLNFITEGKGILQTSEGEYEISPGSIMIIKPGVKHRYKPYAEVGWTENYLGFSGNLANHFMQRVFAEFPEEPVIRCGAKSEIFNCYHKIYDMVIDQRPSYQKISSGLLIELLGYLNSELRSQQFDGKEVDSLVFDAKSYMWENVDGEVDFKAFSRRSKVSYSYFRKMFKLYTGIAPHQFYLDIKMMRARELLVTTDLPIKEIAYKLGFDSLQYFSRIFKSKTSQTPTDIRRQEF